MDVELTKGRIEVITGNMYAGKTEELLRRIRRIKYAKKTIIVFKPKIDDRYSKEEVVSHDNGRIESHIIEDAKEIMKYIRKPYPYAVAIDEVQFFSRDLVFVAEKLADMGIRVLLAGLDCDFRGEPFGIMPELLARAESVTKLNAICQVCGAIATRTQRLINGEPANYNDPIILIGAKEQYEARCRNCHSVPGKPLKFEDDN